MLIETLIKSLLASSYLQSLQVFQSADNETKIQKLIKPFTPITTKIIDYYKVTTTGQEVVYVPVLRYLPFYLKSTVFTKEDLALNSTLNPNKNTLPTGYVKTGSHTLRVPSYVFTEIKTLAQAEDAKTEAIYAFVVRLLTKSMHPLFAKEILNPLVDDVTDVEWRYSEVLRSIHEHVAPDITHSALRTITERRKYTAATVAQFQTQNASIIAELKHNLFLHKIIK